MPRNVDPGSIKVGKGLAPEGTVEDNSLRYPERDVDPLRVHLHDPSRSHMASSIGIVDEGDCYVSDEVEGALQEICGGASAGRLNGLVSGGTFDELGNVANGTGSVATTLLTLVNPTEIMVGAGVYDASGLVADLTGLGAGDYYVYFDTDSASPTFRTLLVSGAAPEVETGAGIEDVLIAKFTYDGANVTEWQDGRFFVRNLDRKVRYSSRQGENVDAWSEGCFATLQAFFLWMVEYGDGGTSEEEKGTVLVRGTHALTGTLTIPTDHLQFIGDGEAVIEGGNFAGPLVDVTGRTGITFRGITFGYLGAPVTAAVQGGDLTADLLVESCLFNGSFPDAVRVNSPGSNAVSIRVLNCRSVLAGTAINLTGVISAHITDLVATGGNSGIGVNLNGCTDAAVRGCRVADHTNGVNVQANSNRVRVSECALVGCVTGVFVNASQSVLVSNNQVSLSPVGAADGVFATGSQSVSVEGNQITTAGSGNYGIRLLGLVTDSKVQNNQIDGFIGVSPVMRGVGVFSDPLSGNAPYLGSVMGNTIRRCSDGIVIQGVSTGIIKDFTISDNLLESIVHTQDGRSNTFDDIGTKGIGLDFCAGIKITGNTVTGTGVLLDNARNPVVLGVDVFPLPIFARNSDTLHITDNTVMAPVAQGAGVSEGIVVMVSGYGASYTASDIVVAGNQVTHDAPAANSGILFGAIDAVDIPGFFNVKVLGNQIVGGKGANVLGRGISFSSGDPFNPGNVYGANFLFLEVKDNSVTGFDVAGVEMLSGGSPAQAHISSFNRVLVSGNVLEGSNPTGVQRGVWVDVGSVTQPVNLSDLVVENNTISGGAGAFGVQIHADKDAASVSSATFESVSIVGNSFPSLSGGTAIEIERTGDFLVAGTRHDLVVSRNTLPRTSAVGGASKGLVLNLGSVNFTGLTVEDNIFEVSENAGLAVDVALLAPSPGLSALTDVSFDRNKVRALGANQESVVFTLGRTSVVDFSMRGNYLHSTLGLGATSGIRSVYLNLINDQATSTEARRLVVSDNHITGGRFQVNSTGISFFDCEVSNNHLQVAAFAELTERAAIGVASDSTNATTICSGFRVEGNTITGGNYGISFGMEDFSSEDGIRISGNTISGLVAPTNTGSIGIYAHAFNRTNIVTNDLRIEDNAVSDYTYRGIYLGLDPSTNINAYAVSVSQNTVLGTHNNIATGDATDGVAIEVFMQCNGLCDAVGLRVDGNRICESLESGVVRRPYRGILFTAPTNTTSKEPLQSVSISENVLHVESGYGIDAHFHQVSDNPYFLYDAKFDRNQIRSVNGTNGLAVEATCRFQTMSISGNTVMGLNRTDPGLHEHGIWLYHEFTETEAVSDSGGTDIVGRDVGGGVLTSYAFTVNGDSVDAVAWEDLTISGNTVMWNAEIPQNPISFTDKAAIAVSHVGGGGVAVCLWGYSLTGNTLRAYKTEAGINTNKDARLIGYSGSIVRTSQVLWPDESIPLFDTTQYLQRGWVFTGNSATDFMRKDRSTALFYGLCVRAIFGPLAAPTAESGASSGNAAYDFGGGPGWGVFGLTSGTNLNGEPRTF
jgi:hypothetical protein